MEDKTMDVMNLAKGLLVQKLGGNNAAVGAVLSGLLGGGGQGGGLDLGGLVKGLESKGLGDIAGSWLIVRKCCS